MDQAEIDALVRVQQAYLEQIGPDTVITAEMVCRMHREWLGDIFTVGRGAIAPWGHV